MDDELDRAWEHVADIRDIAEDAGFHGTAGVYYTVGWAYVQTVIYEEELKSGQDVLAFQIVSDNHSGADRSRYEIYDYGHHYNTIANDFFQNTDPVFSTSEFSEAKTEWIERVEQKQVRLC